MTLRTAKTIRRGAQHDRHMARVGALNAARVDAAQWRAASFAHTFHMAADIDGGSAAPLLKHHGLARPYPASLRTAALMRRGQRSEAIVGAISPLARPHDVRGVAALWLDDLTAEWRAPDPGTASTARGCGCIMGEVRTAVVVAEDLLAALIAGRMIELPAVAAITPDAFASLELPTAVRTVFVAHDADPGDESAEAVVTFARRARLFGASVALLAPPVTFSTWRAYGRATAAKQRKART